MRTLTLYRMRETPTATFGRIEAEDSAQLCVTLEPTDKRIPAGAYTCRRDLHGKSKPNPYECWEVCDVPERSEIHVHIGNVASDSEGCILVGSAFHGPDAISGSKYAFTKLMRETRDATELTLIVQDIPT